MYNDTVGAIQGYNDQMGELIATTLKELLEKKHLYQSVTLDEAQTQTRFFSKVESQVKNLLNSRGTLADLPSASKWILSAYTRSMNTEEDGRFVFTPSHVKLFCLNCDRVEAFNLVSADSIVREQYHKASQRIEGTYLLIYQCQSCKTIPEAFLVRRSGGKLILSGRSPMEHVPVPLEIPKSISSYYSGAVLAHQSGQTLAALFMLRTTCEQWAQQFAEPTDKADIAIEKYMATLPEDFKGRFPSIRQIYDRLSADIHAATGSKELYSQTIADIDLHFQARRLFKELKVPQ